MNRLGRGYSFEALRAKILFTEGSHKQKLAKPKFERFVKERPAPPYGSSEEGEGVFGNVTGASRRSKSFIDLGSPKPKSTQIEKPEKNYGVDISTLIRLIEDGEL